MRDRQTGSLWSQISGECIAGPMKGKLLRQYPLAMSTFEQFRQHYPKGILLKKPDRGRDGSGYDKYFADSTRLGIFGRANNFTRLPAKALVFGIRSAGIAIAVTEEYITGKEFELLQLGRESIILYYSAGTVTAFQLPKVNRAKLTVQNGILFLTAIGKSWDLTTGYAESGGDKLQPVAVTTAFWFAWASFFPESELIK